MNSVFHVCCILVYIFVVSACHVEQAEPSKYQILRIGSDCLYPKDTALFLNFQKKTGIRVKIRHLSADSIQKHLAHYGVLSSIDCIVLSSIFPMKKLASTRDLQSIPAHRLPSNTGNFLPLNSRKWFPIGIDPYVLHTRNDSLKTLDNYSDLLHHPFYTTLESPADWYPFYTYILEKNTANMSNLKHWKHQLDSNNLGLPEVGDSVSIPSAKEIFLTKYSVFQQVEQRKQYRLKKAGIIFPDQLKKGVFANFHCFAVVRQSTNYSNALELFAHLLSPGFNRRLNAHFGTLPLSQKAQKEILRQEIRFYLPENLWAKNRNPLLRKYLR